MSDCSLVFIGPNPQSNLDHQENVYTLVQFLFEKHQEFDLEESSTETYLLPKDELTLIRLVLREFEKLQNPMKEDHLVFWFRICRYRLYRDRSLVSDDEYEFCLKIEEYLVSNNLVDRVLIARRLLVEFVENITLKLKLFYPQYIVQSNKLDWFEYLVVEMLADFKVPHLSFAYLSTTESNFYYCHQCKIDFNVRYKECVNLETLLSYLGLAVNIKDSLRLLKIFNLPYRGLNEHTFTALRKIAQCDNLSVTQVAVSFVGRLRLGDSSYAPESNHPLRQWSSGLIHLVDSLNSCHDILSGAADDSLLAAGSANSLMSVDDAVQSVSQCLRASCRILRKPGIVDKAVHKEVKPIVNLTKLSSVCDDLVKRIRKLSSTIIVSKMCCDTPDRPAIAGGSVRGRAAYKLIRLLLVTESERLRSNSVEFNNSAASPVIQNNELPNKDDCSTTPLSQLSKSDTPTTDGRTCRLLQMFISPSTPLVNNLKPVVRNIPSPQDRMNDENCFVPMPKRIVMSHYQSNLEWVSSHCSPLVTHSFSIDETKSLPCWNIQNEDSQSNASFTKEDKDLNGYSEPGTPTKLFRKQNRRSRALFTEENSESDAKTAQCNTLLNSKVTSNQIAKSRGIQNTKKSTNQKKRSKTVLCTVSSNKQRSLLEFFKS
ncbi:unnamed protein product [Trichobilharzia szidati]|nr:unnamed protein product [Trichobilharzia szidati]